MIVSHAFYAPCKLIQKLMEIRGHEILFITLRRSKTKNQFRSESMLYLKESARKSTGVNLRKRDSWSATRFLLYLGHKRGVIVPSVPWGRPWKLGLRIVAWSKSRMFSEESLGKINLKLFRNVSVHEFYRLKALITLEQVNTTNITEWSEKK